MGLDMYLFTRNENGDLGDEIAYWRKANHVHGFFVDVVQKCNDDCGDYNLTLSDLETLKHTCEDVLDNPRLAKELLPTMDGFFFGATDYDSRYFGSLSYTVEACNKAIACIQEGKTVVYSSSW